MGQGKENKQNTVGVISLGCPKNLVDTEKMLARFQAAGYGLTADPRQADLLVVNTCGFIEEAKAESVEAILEMARVKKQRKGGKERRLVVTGCLAQRYGKELAREIPEIDLVVGSSQYHELIDFLGEKKGKRVRVAAPIFQSREPMERVLSTPAHTAYLKIAEGCDNPCAFCVIPQLRGPFCSRGEEEILAEANHLVRGGVRELILVSQDTTLYGRDLQPRRDLAGLLTRLSELPDVAWIRLLYLYPTLINDAFLEALAGRDKLLDYFDLPLQHSHSDVLRRMRRAERSEGLALLVERIRRFFPEAVLRATFIVGFPGESEAEFQHLCDFVEACRFDHVGVFPYSDEEGTAAFSMPDKVPHAVALARKERLMLRQKQISREKLATLVGRVLPVLVEFPAAPGEGWLGRTRGQAPGIDGVVHLPEEGLRPGQIIQARVIASGDYDVTARRVEGGD